MQLQDSIKRLSIDARNARAYAAWQREWRSTHKHNEPHCRARFQEGPKAGQYCQNAMFPGMKFCRTHMEEKWHYCSAMTKAGKQCRKRPFMKWLCVMHWSQAAQDYNLQQVASIKEMLASKTDPMKEK